MGSDGYKDGQTYHNYWERCSKTILEVYIFMSEAFSYVILTQLNDILCQSFMIDDNIIGYSNFIHVTLKIHNIWFENSILMLKSFIDLLIFF